MSMHYLFLKAVYKLKFKREKFRKYEMNSLMIVLIMNNNNFVVNDDRKKIFANIKKECSEFCLPAL